MLEGEGEFRGKGGVFTFHVMVRAMRGQKKTKEGGGGKKNATWLLLVQVTI